VPADAARARDDGRLGEALLAALGRLGAGAGGDPRGVGEGLSALVALGFEGVARRAALQLLLLGEAG